tara:strand:+ start:641 stop:880 length:240 start_codon:yes stop_codon:yes gene_type:complete
MKMPILLSPAKVLHELSLKDATATQLRKKLKNGNIHPLLGRLMDKGFVDRIAIDNLKHRYFVTDRGRKLSKIFGEMLWL